MRTFLIILLVLFILVAGAVGFVFMTFDPNAFKGQVEDYVRQQTGLNLQLGDISLKYGTQLGLSISELDVSDPRSGKSLMHSGNLEAGFFLPALLKKQFVMRSLTIHQPVIYLKRSAEGLWNWEVKSDAQAGPKTPAAQKAAVPSDDVEMAWTFLVSSVDLNGGRLIFEDLSTQPAFQMEINQIDAEVRQAHLLSPVKLGAKAAILGSNTQNTTLNATYSLGEGKLDFELNYGKKELVFNGSVEQLTLTPRFKGTLDVHQMALEPLIPKEFRQGPYVSGDLSAHFDARVIGTNPEIIRRSLFLEGDFDIRSGAIKNLNIARQVFEQLPSIPGLNLSQTLLTNTPEELQPMLSTPDTPFDILKGGLFVDKGRGSVSDLQLQNPDYLLQASGGFGLLDQSLDFNLSLVLLENVSEVIVAKIHELKNVVNRQGRLIFPVRASGVLPRVRVQPDLGYIAQNLIIDRGQELISMGLEKLAKYLEPKQEETAAQQPEDSQTQQQEAQTS